MRNEDISNELSSFIEAISSSNLETLHSKAIAWLFNLPNSPIDLKGFFLSIIFNFSKDSEFEHVVTIAEVASHDLLSLLLINNEFVLVIWENKIKADFHQKKKSQLPLKKKTKKSEEELDERFDKICEILKKYENDWLRGISQPYWYQIRWLLWRLKDGNEIKEKIISPVVDELEEFDKQKFDRLEKIINSKSGTNERKLDKAGMVQYIDGNMRVDWVILSPHKEEHIKIFHNSQWTGLKSFDSGNKTTHIKGDFKLLEDIKTISRDTQISEWKYTTYKSLYKHLNFKRDNSVAKAYLDYVRYNDYFEIYNESSNPKKREWDLNHLIEIHRKLSKENLDFEWLAAGSERNGHPLLNIIIGSIKLNKEKTDELKKILDIPPEVHKSQIDEIGVKLQIQGAVKLQLAHRAYHQVKMKNLEGYKSFVFNLVSQNWINDFSHKEDRLKFIKNNLVADVNTEYTFSENSSSSKTGLSYTIKNPKQGFVNEKNVREIIKAISIFLNNHSFQD